MSNKKLGWVITFYQTSDDGLENLRKLIDILSTENYYLVLSSHSVVPEDIQEKCDYVIFEKCNTVDERQYSHGVPENLSIKHAFDHLKFMGIEWSYKMCYDNEIVDIQWFKNWIKDYKYDFVTCRWGDQILATHSFFCKVDFLLKTFPVYRTIDEMFSHSNVLEICWENVIRSKGLLDKVFSYPSKEEFFGPNKMDKFEFNYLKINVSFDQSECKFYIENKGKDWPFDVYIYDYYTNFLAYKMLNCFLLTNTSAWAIPGCTIKPENGYYVEIYPKNTKTKITRFINVKDFSNQHHLKNKIKTYKKEDPRFHEYYDLMKGDLYKKVDLKEKLKEIKSYVDIGSNFGFASMEYAENPNCNVYMIDADPRNIMLLKKNFNHMGNVKLMYYAIADTDGEVDFYLDKKSTLTSGLTKTMDDREYECLKVPSITPNTLFDTKITEDQIDFLKIDIEGGEYVFFDKISDNNLQKIKQILIEFHQNTDKKLLKILEKLLDNNFDYTWIPLNPYNNPYVLNNEMGIIYATNVSY